MPWTSEHIKWLVDPGERLTTADGKEVELVGPLPQLWRGY